jgi:cob(I)alamin adenosyltransferase
MAATPAGKGRIMKIYTGTGDRGKTGLFSGERISKADARIEAYGDVDELSSVIGALAAALPKSVAEAVETLRAIQSDLFGIGALLATTVDSPSAKTLEPLSDARIRYLEEAIDRIESRLPPLDGFILPGGHPSAGWAHVARTVCRRAERHTVQLSDLLADDIRVESVLVYLNRLSDYLFVLARLANRLTGSPEILWRK